MTEAELRAGRVTDPIRALLEFESSVPGTTTSGRRRNCRVRTPDGFAAARIMGAIYLNLLERIETSGYDVFGARHSRAAMAPGDDCRLHVALDNGWFC